MSRRQVRDASGFYAVPGRVDQMAARQDPVWGAHVTSAHLALVWVLARVADCLAGAGMTCLLLVFSPQKLDQGKFGELDRQLAGQQAGLNALTVEEYLGARARFDPRARDPQVARRARSSWRSKLAAAHGEALAGQGIAPAEAGERAALLADQQMRSLHALHNPDRVVGGHDLIGDFGDGQVNCTIGRQWTLARRGEISRVQQLDAAASRVPEWLRGSTRMNGQLVREAPAVLDAALRHHHNELDSGPPGAPDAT